MPATPTPTDSDFNPGPRGTQRVRIDQGSAGGSDLAPGRGSLLRAFGAWGKRLKSVRAEERRTEDRHDPFECKAWVGWKTWRQFHMNSALVINLSRGGARIFLDTPPPPGKDLWVFLETPGQNAVVKGRAVEVVTVVGGQCTVRLAFSQPCPFAFFEAAVCGLAAANPRMRAAKSPRVMAGGRR